MFPNREKWISLLHHIQNRHSWDGNTRFSGCGHPPLTPEQIRRTKWLEGTSPACASLKAVVTDKALLKALKHMTKFCHTSDLEVFHNMLLKYCSKRQHFHYDGEFCCGVIVGIDETS